MRNIHRSIKAVQHRVLSAAVLPPCWAGLSSCDTRTRKRRRRLRQTRQSGLFLCEWAVLFTDPGAELQALERPGPAGSGWWARCT